LIKLLHHIPHAIIRITPRPVSPTKEFNRILASPVRRSVLKKSGVAITGLKPLLPGMLLEHDLLLFIKLMELIFKFLNFSV
jgi:hypothetical protein